MWLKNYLRSLFLRIPPSADYLRERNIRKNFRVELDLINGRHYNEDMHPSIIHFSVNKSATQYVQSILKRCSLENGMQPVNIHGYAFKSKFPYLDHLSASEMEKYQHIFKQNGYVYSVFGGMIEGIQDLDKYKVIFMIRDPRDILISRFYSIAYSHPVPDKQGNKYESFIEQRIKARESTIDEYVIEESNKVYNIFLRYKNLLIDIYPNVHTVTYEQMVISFQRWLEDLLDYCKLTISDELFGSLVDGNERIKPQKEDIQRHIRQGKYGDYKVKLKPETIEYLNVKLSPILDTFGYKEGSIS